MKRIVQFLFPRLPGPGPRMWAQQSLSRLRGPDGPPESGLGPEPSS
jgi:hypothetical protein